MLSTGRITLRTSLCTFRRTLSSHTPKLQVSSITRRAPNSLHQPAPLSLVVRFQSTKIKKRMPPKKAAQAEKKILLGRPSNNLKIGIVGLPNVGKSSLFNVIAQCGESGRPMFRQSKGMAEQGDGI